MARHASTVSYFVSVCFAAIVNSDGSRSINYTSRPTELEEVEPLKEKTADYKKCMTHVCLQMFGLQNKGESEPPPGELTAVNQTTRLNRLIIYDWDDTFFPTSWLQTFPSFPSVTEEDMPADERAALERIADAALVLLEQSSKLGMITIVTNAKQGWVEQAIREYMPKLEKLIKRGKVIVRSARSLFEDSIGNFPVLWKKNTFEQRKEQLQAQNRVPITEILSVGDQLGDVAAAVQMGEELKHTSDVKFHVKTVKFMSSYRYQAKFSALRNLLGGLERPNIIGRREFEKKLAHSQVQSQLHLMGASSLLSPTAAFAPADDSAEGGDVNLEELFSGLMQVVRLQELEKLEGQLAILRDTLDKIIFAEEDKTIQIMEAKQVEDPMLGAIAESSTEGLSDEA